VSTITAFSFGNIAIDATFQEQLKWIRIHRATPHPGHRGKIPRLPSMISISVIEADPNGAPNRKVTSADKEVDEIKIASRWSMLMLMVDD
jgi:hypothetical protein